MAVPPKRRRPAITPPSGVYRGVVAHVYGPRSVEVRVERLTGRTDFTAEVAEGLWSSDAATGLAGGHAHRAGVDLAEGDRVLVAFVEGRPNDVVVITRL